MESSSPSRKRKKRQKKKKKEKKSTGLALYVVYTRKPTSPEVDSPSEKLLFRCVYETVTVRPTVGILTSVLSSISPLGFSLPESYNHLEE